MSSLFSTVSVTEVQKFFMKSKKRSAQNLISNNLFKPILEVRITETFVRPRIHIYSNKICIKHSWPQSIKAQWTHLYHSQERAWRAVGAYQWSQLCQSPNRNWLPSQTSHLWQSPKKLGSSSLSEERAWWASQLTSAIDQRKSCTTWTTQFFLPESRESFTTQKTQLSRSPERLFTS
jgi:hypothetical protein